MCSELGTQRRCEVSALLEKAALQSVSTHSWRRALASWRGYCVLEEPCIPPAGELGAGSEQRMLPGGQTTLELWPGSRPSMGSLDFPTLSNPPKSVPKCLPISIKPTEWVHIQFRSKTNLWSNNGQVGAPSLKHEVSRQAVGGVALESAPVRVRACVRACVRRGWGEFSGCAAHVPACSAQRSVSAYCVPPSEVSGVASLHTAPKLRWSRHGCFTWGTEITGAEVPCKQVKLDRDQRKRRRVRESSFYYPGSIFIFREFLVGLVGDSKSRVCDSSLNDISQVCFIGLALFNLLNPSRQL